MTAPATAPVLRVVVRAEASPAPAAPGVEDCVTDGERLCDIEAAGPTDCSCEDVADPGRAELVPVGGIGATSDALGVSDAEPVALGEGDAACVAVASCEGEGICVSVGLAEEPGERACVADPVGEGVRAALRVRLRVAVTDGVRACDPVLDWLSVGGALAVPVCEALRLEGTWLGVRLRDGDSLGVPDGVKLALAGGAARSARHGCELTRGTKLQNGPPGFEAQDAPAPLS